MTRQSRYCPENMARRVIETPDEGIDVTSEVQQFQWNSRRQNGEAIRAAREDAGFPRRQLAHRMGVEARTLARWELDGTEYDNLVKAFQSIRALRLNMEGVTPAGRVVDLSKVSTVDLAEELVRRSRMMEDRDRKLLEHRTALENAGLGHHFPKGL